MIPSQPSRLRGEGIVQRSARPAAVALLLLAVALRFWDLGRPSLWYDEAYSWWVGTQVSRTGALISSLREFIPPLTYFGWRLWAAATGTSELALRASSALAGVLTVAALGAVAGRLSRSRTTALAALALAAVSPPLVWASRELRMYGPLLAFVALGDLALVEVLLGPARHRRHWAWAWGAAAVAALYTVALAGFWLIGQGCFALVALATCRDRARRQALIRALFFPALAAAVAFLAWLLPALPYLNGNHGYWPGTLTAAEFFSRTVRGITLYDAIGPEATALHAGIAIVALAMLVPPLVWWRREGVALGSAFPLVTTLPPLIVAAAVFHSVPKWNLQHTVIFAPGVVLGLALAVPPFVFPPRASECTRGKAEHLPPPSGPFRRRRGEGWGGGRITAAALVAAAAVAMAYATVRLLTAPDLARDDWRGLVAYVQANRTDGEVVIIEMGAAKQSWLYYGDDEGLLPLPDDALLDVTHTLHYTNTAPVLNTALARAPGVWVVGWLDDVTDPTDIVGTLLEDIGESAETTAFQGLTLHHYTLTRAPDFGEEPATSSQPDIELLPGVRLWGVTLPETPQPADSLISVRAWWTVSDPAQHTGNCYLASVRIYDRLGNRWGSIDGPAAAGDLRAEYWPAGQPVLGRYDVPLLLGAPSGTYTVTTVLYELNDAGAVSSEIPVGSIAVGRPSTVPVPDGSFAPVTQILPSGKSKPLDLLGALIETNSVRPCDALRGWLFWEVTTPVPVTEGEAVRIALDESSITLESADILPSQWEVGDRFVTLFRLPIDCRALQSKLPLTISLLQGEPEQTAEIASWIGPEVETIVERAFEPPANLTPVTAPVAVDTGTAEGVLAELLGYSLEPATTPADTAFRLVLTWRAGTITDTPYTVFVHVTPRGQPSPLAAQHDAWPAMGGKPTYTWVPGEIITDPHDLPGLPPGEYDIRIGVYGPDVVRLPLTQDGTRVLDDVLVLTTITVE